jgi:hypothetical protein
MANYNNNIKNLNKQIEQNINTFDSYYGSMSGILDTIVGKSKEVKDSFKEVNDILEQQVEQNKKLNATVVGLAEHYSVSKKEMTEALKSLEKYAKVQKEIGRLEAAGADSEYIEKLRQKNELLKQQHSHLGDLFDRYNETDGAVRDYFNTTEELACSTENLKEAQERYNESLEKTAKKWEKIKKSGILDFLKGVKDGLLTLGKVGYEKFKEVDQAGHDFGRTMGMSTDELNKHTTSLFNNYKGLAYKLGMEFKDMYKFQTSYAETTQKAVMLSTDQIGSMAALSRNVGEEAVSVASKNLDIFATSADATIEYLAKGTARASLEGLNVKKYSEAFANNIKMASKYTFKEGITGVQKMTLLSQRLKFNMESIGAVMDKFSTIEGAIEASSKIQVLGGAFASNFGNPLEAMSQALLDGEGFTKRIIKTVASQARFNSKTGEIDLSPIDKQRMKAYADALGISYDEVYNMASQTRKGSEIERILGKGKFDESTMAYLTNKSQYNKEKGIWELIDVEGKSHDISKLSKEQLNAIRSVDTHEKLLNSNVSAIKTAVQQIASEQTSHSENITKYTESTKLLLAGFVDGLENSFSNLFAMIASIGGLGLTGAFGSMGSGLFKGIKNRYLSSARGGGPKVGSKASGGGMTSSGGVGTRRPSAKLLKFAKGSKSATKFITGKGGGALAVIGGGLGVYNALSDYSDSEQAILNSNMTASEKETAIAQAKVDRNKGVGGSVGGALGGWGGALAGAKVGALAGGAIGSFVPVVGNAVGAAIGGIIGAIGGGIGGSMLGNSIGESVGEAVSDKVKEKQEKKPNDIKVDDIKVNVSGNVKLVADGSSGIDISALMKNNTFRKGIGDIVQEHIKKQVGGRTTES